MTDRKSTVELSDQFAGLLVGTAVGDSLGLPAEGMSRQCIQRRWHGVEKLLTHLPSLGKDSEWQAICHKITDALASAKSVEEFADSLGLQRGVSGYAYHSVPVALYASLHHSGNFRQALESALNCGGDTDTVGAITGALVGAMVRRQGIPVDLTAGIWEWPRSIALREGVAAKLAEQSEFKEPLGTIPSFWPGLILRNILFAVVVLAHGFRRLAPPY